jgi:hypothetical protein
VKSAIRAAVPTVQGVLIQMEPFEEEGAGEVEFPHIIG